MKYLSTAIVLPVVLSAYPYFEYDESQAQKAVTVQFESMPQIPESSDSVVAEDVLEVYYFLKKEFNISQTRMAEWLGMKRRSLYNWLKNPESSDRKIEIENRLKALESLAFEMEPEHRIYLEKISSSPIYGDPAFQAAILSGESSDYLIEWYDTLFDKFESYRQNAIKNAV